MNHGQKSQGSTTITRSLMRDLPPLPDGTGKRRVFDNRITGFIAEQRPTGVTFYLRYTDIRRRTHELRLGRLGDVTVDHGHQN
jgi:hypothetical protein